jgi:DNA-binding transcriptional MerR regulator
VHAAQALPDTDLAWIQPQINLGLVDTSEAVYGQKEVRRYTGVSPRQLDHWATKGIFEPSVYNARGSGSRRLYSFRDILAIRLLKRLIDTGVTLEKVGMAVDTLRHLGEEDLAGIVLVSDGHTVYQLRSDDELIDLVHGGQAVFLIAVTHTLRDLRSALAAPAPVADLTKRPRPNRREAGRPDERA